ncbi:SDR family oxidoreductase [Mesorhizobium sp. M0833]
MRQRCHCHRWQSRHRAGHCRETRDEEATVFVGDLFDERPAPVSSVERLAFAPLDVTKEASVRTFVEEVLQKFGRIDILVNNAGVVIHKSIDEQTVEDWDRLMAVNLRGPFLMAKYVAAEMRRIGSGAIVNIGSVEGFVVNPGIQPMPPPRPACTVSRWD